MTIERTPIYWIARSLQRKGHAKHVSKHIFECVYGGGRSFFVYVCVRRGRFWGMKRGEGRIKYCAYILYINKFAVEH